MNVVTEHLGGNTDLSNLIRSFVPRRQVIDPMYMRFRERTMAIINAAMENFADGVSVYTWEYDEWSKPMWARIQDELEWMGFVVDCDIKRLSAQDKLAEGMFTVSWLNQGDDVYELC